MIHDNLLLVEKLDLSGRELKDIAEINVLINLAELDISDNPLADISVTHGLGKLRKLTMRGVNVSEKQIAALREVNPKCEIIV